MGGSESGTAAVAECGAEVTWGKWEQGRMDLEGARMELGGNMVVAGELAGMHFACR